MTQLVSFEELLERAYALAYFIHADKHVALRIAAGALNKLEVAAAAQYRRLYYTPRGRRSNESGSRAGFRTKVSLTELHLLQWLVYHESTPYERQQERELNATSAGEEEMIVHFVKHLVCITVRRNSFHVALAISRLLHDYSTPETMDIYDAVSQSPDRMRDGDYFRARKARLMDEVKERFGNIVRVVRGHRGEDRFQTQEAAPKLVNIVRDCLGHFAPWGTPCTVPAGFNPTNDEIRSLSSADCNPDEEHTIEINRAHSLIHPDCYRRLTDALGLHSPDQRLAVPSFFLGNNNHNQGSKPDRGNAPKLDPDDMERVKGHLEEEADRRRATFGVLLRILVDGIECDRVDLRCTNRVRVRMEEDARFVEVLSSARGSEVLLAVYAPPRHAELKQDIRQEIRLEGGQTLLFVARSAEAVSRNGMLIVDIDYRETRPVRAAIRTLQRWRFKLWRPLSAYPSASAPLIARILVISLAGLLALATWTYMRNRPEATDSKSEQVEKTALPDEGIPPAIASNGAASSQQTEHDQNPRAKIKAGSRPRVTRKATDQFRARSESFSGSKKPPELSDSRDHEADETRSVNSRSDRPPARIERIFIETRGPARLSKRIRDLIVRALEKEDGFKVGDRESADAALKISTAYLSNNANRSQKTVTGEQLPSNRTALTISLVDSDGQIIWPLSGRPSRYEGTPEEAASKAIVDLKKQVPSSEGKH